MIEHPEIEDAAVAGITLSVVDNRDMEYQLT